VPKTILVSRGGCIASALTGQSTVEVVGAVLGTVGGRAGRGLGAVAARRVAAADRPAHGQAGTVGAGLRAPERRGTTAHTASQGAVSEHGRPRGDQPRRGCRRVVPADRGAAGAGPVNGGAGAGPQRRPWLLSGPGRRRRGLSPRPAAQAGQAGGRAAAAGGGGGQAGPAVVTRADRRLVAVGRPFRSGAAGVARDDLSVAVRPEPGGLRRELQRCLRTGRAMRFPRGKRLPQGRGQLRDTLHSSQRLPRRPTGRCPAIGRAT
jgi:hypothetical protein